MTKKSLFDCGIEIKKDSWYEIFSASLGKAAANQEACSNLVVKKRNWNVDFSKGMISFGTDEYPLQFIGSESASSNTWLWGWENINGFDERIISLANQMKKFGKAYGLDAFSTAEFVLDETFNGHTLAIAACGLAEEKLCYYRGPHDGGAILVAFSDVPDEVFAPVDGKTFADLTMQCIQQFGIDHRIFVQSFLYQNDTPFEWKGDHLIARFASPWDIEFEMAGDRWRIKNINGII